MTPAELKRQQQRIDNEVRLKRMKMERTIEDARLRYQLAISTARQAEAWEAYRKLVLEYGGRAQ